MKSNRDLFLEDREEMYYRETIQINEEKLEQERAMWNMLDNLTDNIEKTEPIFSKNSVSLLGSSKEKLQLKLVQ